MSWVDDDELKPLSLDDKETYSAGSDVGNEENYGDDFHVPLEENSSKIKNADSNFVFFFGTSESGKSVILSSMLYYLSSRAGVLRPKLDSPNTREAQVLLSDFFENIRQGILPNRTTRDQVTRLDLVFEPNNKSKKVQPINLTFLETSGENHNEIRRGGSYHSSIDAYLNAEIPLTFIIVTSFESAHKEDTIINEFFDELVRKNRNARSVNVILVVSKWDKSGSSFVSNEEELESFINERLSRTSQRLNTYGYAKTYYTIGSIQGTKGNERITMLNLSTAEILSKWLYESITNYPLDYEGTFWERIKFSFSS